MRLAISGRVGWRVQGLFAEPGTRVVGAKAAKPEDLVRRHLASTLTTGPNVCDH